MDRNYLPLWLKRIWLFVLLIAPLIPTFLPQSFSNTTVALIVTPPYILWVGTLLYHQWDKFYFWFTRSLLWVSNATVLWSLKVEFFQGEHKADLIAMVDEAKKLDKGLVVWEKSAEQSIIKTSSGYVVRLLETSYPNFDEPDELVDVVYLQSNDIPVPFRHSQKALDELVSIIDTMKKVVGTGKEKYILQVNFGTSNPYFGLFLRQLREPQHQLKTFICEFTVRTGANEENIQVTQKQVSLVTGSLTSLTNLSRRFVTLASLDLSTP